MPLNVNYKEASETQDLSAGEYEVIIKYVSMDVTKTNNTAYISVVLIIRNDVDQPCKNKHIWYKLWKRKTPSPADKGCGGFSSKQIQTLSKSAKLADGASYEGLDDWFAALQNRLIRVTVKIDETYGPEVAYVNESKFPDCKHVFKNINAEASRASGYDPEEDPDLPF